MAVTLSGVVYSGGSLQQGATVEAFDRGTTSPALASTATDGQGRWSLTLSRNALYDVKITYGGEVIWLRAQSGYAFDEAVVSNLRVLQQLVIPESPQATLNALGYNANTGRVLVWNSTSDALNVWDGSAFQSVTPASGLNQAQVDARIEAELPTPTQSQAEDTTTTRYGWTPQRIRNAIGAGIDAILETITEADAEGGTSTTRRIWTSQRVRQAVDKRVDGARVVSLLTGLEGSSRLPATAIRGLPSTSSGGLGQSQVDARILSQLPTISASEATAGTSTSRRAVTGERLREAADAAIAAKFTVSTSAPASNQGDNGDIWFQREA